MLPPADHPSRDATGYPMTVDGIDIVNRKRNGK